MAAEANVKSGALIGFKVGLQSTVDTMLSQGTAANADHGCFYLTKDAHRLYVGNEDGSLSAVNEGIEWIEQWSDLQAIATTAASAVSGAKYLTGRFYYVQERNVLCVYNGSKWIQLNENSNTLVQSNTYTITAANDTATITNTIRDDDGGEFTDSFTVTGANGIKITSSGKAITLTGDTYTLSSNQSGNNVQIKLDSSETNNDSMVTLVKGANVTLTKAADSNNVTIAAKDTTNTSAAITTQANTAGFTFTVTDSDGQDVTATTDPKIAIYTTPTPTGTTTNSVSFMNGTATLDVYSRSAIDSKLQAVNAMTYKGTVGPTGTGAASITYANNATSILDSNGQPVGVSIGDTFLTTQAGTYNNISYKPNSLFIARSTDGTERADGTIDPSKLIFDVVAEQWFPDTTYSLVAITSGIALQDKNGGHFGSLVVTAGDNNNWIQVSEGGTTGATSAMGDNKVLTITHKDVTRTDGEDTTITTSTTQNPVASMTIPAVTKIVTDSKGHITSVKTKNYVLTDTNATLKEMTTSTSAYRDTTNGYSAGVIGTQTVLKQSDGTEVSKSAAVVVSSSSLSITDEDTRPTTQGGSITPGGLKIEMLWGEF